MPPISMPRTTLSLLLPVLCLSPLLAQEGGRPVDQKLARRVTPIVEVARDASPTVVYIKTEAVQAEQDFFGRMFARKVEGSGSGVVIHKDGFIITNYHVIRGARAITVQFDEQYDSKRYTAEVKSFVPEEDLALLRISGAREFPAIPMGTSSDLMPGETVVAIGNPYGQTYTVSTGIISGLHRNIQIPQENLEFDDLIQTDAGINPGNSGGPLLNINGELIGINNAMNSVAENIGFAIPVDRVRKVLEEQLLAPESSDTWLGFDVKFSDHAQVKSVVPGSPANIAGLQPGDCIVSIGGKGVAKPDEYAFARAAVSAQKEVEIVVERDGGKRQLKVEPWNRVDGQLYERIGVRLRDVEGRSNRWIEVREVRGGSPAAKLGLKAGDVLETARPLVGVRPRAWRLDDKESLARLVAPLDRGTRVELDVYRDADLDKRLTDADLLRGTLTLD
jgi:serine protease Do